MSKQNITVWKIIIDTNLCLLFGPRKFIPTRWYRSPKSVWPSISKVLKLLLSFQDLLSPKLFLSCLWGLPVGTDMVAGLCFCRSCCREPELPRRAELWKILIFFKIVIFLLWKYHWRHKRVIGKAEGLRLKRGCSKKSDKDGCTIKVMVKGSFKGSVEHLLKTCFC